MLFGSCCIRMVVPFEPRISCPNASPMTLWQSGPIGRLSSVLGRFSASTQLPPYLIWTTFWVAKETVRPQ